MNFWTKHKLQTRLFFQSAPLPKWIARIAAILFPLWLSVICNYISYASLASLQTLLVSHIGAFLFGALLAYGIYALFLCVCRSFWGSATITGFLLILLSLVDYFKFLIIKEHFYPWDMLFAKNAASFTEFLGSIVFPWQYIVCIVCTIFYILFLYFTGITTSFGKKRFIGIPIVLAALVLFIKTPAIRGQYDKLFGIDLQKTPDQGAIYQTYGFLSGFALNFGSVDTLRPDDYDKQTIQTMFAEYIPTDTTIPEDFQNPDIIVVLSEAFWDVTKLKDVSFSADPLVNYRRIAAQHPSGEMVSPTFGGGTVRPEFEILTGMSTSALPKGNMPYQQYLKQKTFSYPHLFKSLGYDAYGIHTYQETFYDRNKAYPFMGFDDFYGENEMHTELHWNSGPYITDETIADEIIYQLEQPHETGVFLSAITMENHSMYTNKYDAADWDITVSGDKLSEQEVISLQNYCEGTKNADAALGKLYDYIMQREKPTILLWYGDHLPTLGDNFTPYISTETITKDVAAQWSEEEKYMMFSTPYVMFANYDTGKAYLADEQRISPFLLPALLCDYIQAPTCLQTNFLLDVYHHCPVMSRYYNLFSPDCPQEQRERILKLHQYLTYDELVGDKYLNAMQGFDF